MKELPTISCIMPTYNRRMFVPRAIEFFLRQDYPNRELIIVDDGTDPIIDLIPDDLRVRYVRLKDKYTVGAKRNLACREAKGEIIVHWDDDDWMASRRLSYQVDYLLKEQVDLCGLSKILYTDPARKKSWQYTYPSGQKPWLAGGTFCYTKDFWQSTSFPEINVGEDTYFVKRDGCKKIIDLQDNTFYIALIHAENTDPKRTAEARWRPYPTETIQSLIGEDWSFYNNL